MEYKRFWQVCMLVELEHTSLYSSNAYSQNKMNVMDKNLSKVSLFFAPINAFSISNFQSFPIECKSHATHDCSSSHQFSSCKLIRISLSSILPKTKRPIVKDNLSVTKKKKLCSVEQTSTFLVNWVNYFTVGFGPYVLSGDDP